MDKRSMIVVGEPVRVTCNGRRYFSRAHKDAIVAKCLLPGASLAAVALANGFNANLVRRWVDQSQVREACSKPSARLLPVTIEPDQTRKAGADGVIRLGRASEPGSMEIRIGRVELIVHGTVEREQLSIVLETLLRSR
jgi:transposase